MVGRNMTAYCLKNYHMWFKSLAHGGSGDRVRVKFRSTSLHLCAVGQGLCVRATSDGCCLELWCPWAVPIPWDPASLLGPAIQGSRGGSKRHSKPHVVADSTAGTTIFILGICNIHVSCVLPLKRRNKSERDSCHLKQISYFQYLSWITSVIIHLYGYLPTHIAYRSIIHQKAD